MGTQNLDFRLGAIFTGLICAVIWYKTLPRGRWSSRPKLAGLNFMAYLPAALFMLRSNDLRGRFIHEESECRSRMASISKALLKYACAHDRYRDPRTWTTDIQPYLREKVSLTCPRSGLPYAVNPRCVWSSEKLNHKTMLLAHGSRPVLWSKEALVPSPHESTFAIGALGSYPRIVHMSRDFFWDLNHTAEVEFPKPAPIPLNLGERLGLAQARQDIGIFLWLASLSMGSLSWYRSIRRRGLWTFGSHSFALAIAISGILWMPVYSNCGIY